jgi:hypothetical protein
MRPAATVAIAQCVTTQGDDLVHRSLHWLAAVLVRDIRHRSAASRREPNPFGSRRYTILVHQEEQIESGRRHVSVGGCRDVNGSRRGPYDHAPHIALVLVETVGDRTWAQ